MPLHKKYFIHYYRVSVNEGLNKLSTCDLMLEKLDKEVFQRYGFCHCTIEIKKSFTKEKDVCDYCLSLLENEDQDNPKIHIIWTENQKYGVFTNFHRAFVDRIFRYEKISNKTGKISQEMIENHLNICDSFI